jgi:hypothetical protein
VTVRAQEPKDSDGFGLLRRYERTVDS